MVDIVIVCLSLLLTVIVGYISGRKVKNIKDFVGGGKRFPMAMIMMTIFATWMGGDDLIGVSERVYSIGIVYVVYLLSQSSNAFVTAYCIAPKILEHFSNKISIGEIMGELYGKAGQCFTGIAGIMLSLGYIAIQESSIGYVCNMFFGIPHVYGCVIGSLIIIAYSTFGGVRSVIYTDVLQFFILIVAIPIIGSVILRSVGGFDALITSLPKSHTSIDIFSDGFIESLLLFLVCIFPGFSPIMTQRILLSKNAEQATKSLSIAGVLYIPFYATIIVIALCAVILFPNIEPNLAFLNALNYSLPPVVKGIAVAGVLAVMMSTADSHLNVAVISSIKDIAPIICSKKVSDRNQLKIARYTTVILGLMAIFVSTCFQRMIDFWLYFGNFWDPTVAAPMFLFVLFKIKTSIKHYIISLLIGFGSIYIYRMLMPKLFFVASQLFGMLVTMLIMYIFYRFEKKEICI